MNYRPLKNQRRQAKAELRRLKEFDLYFEEVPPTTVYKLQRALSRNLRKLKAA